MSAVKNCLLLLILLFLFSCSTASMVAPKTVSVKGIKMYYTLGGVGDEMKRRFDSVGFSKIVLINQRRIVTKTSQWEIDEQNLKKFVLEKIPDPTDNVVIMLNWEGEVFKSILSGRDDPNFSRAGELFIKAYSIVKQMRPKAMIGYYGLPIRNYWSRDERWRGLNQQLDGLVKNFDVIFPSIYDFYDSATYQGKGDIDYVQDNVAESVRMGERLRKPVMPVVWHRYHNSNKTVGLDLIPPKEFSDHIAAAATVEINEKGIDGIVWWGSEYSFYSRRNRKKFANIGAMRKVWEKEMQETLPKYYSAICEGLNQRSR